MILAKRIAFLTDDISMDEETPQGILAEYNWYFITKGVPSKILTFSNVYYR